MSNTLIRLTEVQRRTGYSKAWIYRLMGQGKFPASVKIGSRAIAFVESEIDEWINQRIAESRGLPFWFYYQGVNLQKAPRPYIHKYHRH